MLRLITLTAAATLVAGPALATVVIPFETDYGYTGWPFPYLPSDFGFPDYPVPELEKGFVYDNQETYRAPEDNFLYLEDDSGFTSSTFEHIGHLPFRAHAADVVAYGQIYLSAIGAHPDGNTDREYVLGGELMHIEYVDQVFLRAEGFRDGTLVAGESLGFSVEEGLSSYPPGIRFNTAFHDLDYLTLSLELPDAFAGIRDISTILDMTPAAGEFFCVSWCAGLKVDNLRLSPVPLPGGLALLGTALPLLALGRRRRRA